MSTTIGQYIAKRLEQVNLKHYFAIPGDYNLLLLDQLLLNKKLQPIYCCNELNAGYAADGYSRVNGFSAAFVTHTVGGLSIINAVAGAYAEDLPMLIVSGGPNTNSEAEYQILHHTLGTTNYQYMREIYAHVTAYSEVVKDIRTAPKMIDHAIKTALYKRKPVFLEVACNIAGLEISDPHTLMLSQQATSDKHSLKAAVKHASQLIEQSKKVVLVAGGKLRACHAESSFETLAKKSQYATAIMPDAKGMVDETLENYIGMYWGSVSTPACREIVESADLYLYAGPRFTDYSTVGYSAVIEEKKLIHVGPDFVRLQGQTYNYVYLAEFLEHLSEIVSENTNSLTAYNRIAGEAPIPEPGDIKAPLSRRRLFANIQSMLDESTTVIAETGDSWFNGLGLKLPQGAQFEIQMQFGSIGWSTGALLGAAANTSLNRKVIALIGDGSFQLTAQEISTLIRYDIPATVFLINNAGYVIEVEIHDGPYNEINNWKYAQLIEVFNDKGANAKGYLVKTEDELRQAITDSQQRGGLNFIEVIIDRADCNKNLLSWGTTVAKNNARPPR